LNPAVKSTGMRKNMTKITIDIDDSLLDKIDFMAKESRDTVSPAFD